MDAEAIRKLAHDHVYRNADGITTDNQVFIVLVAEIAAQLEEARHPIWMGVDKSSD